MYKSALRAVVFASVVFTLSSSQSHATDNVLLLIADDYGVDSMGLYAPTQDVAPTPNLDALAATGVRFTNFWANPICSPTRAALLTGRHGFRTGVGSPQGNNTIPLTEYTLADVMNSQGYHTANFGKWHLGNGNSGPNVMGWDHFVGITGGGVQNYYSWTKNTNGTTAPSTTYTTTDQTDEAIAWISGKGTDPWFCWMAYNAPHTPFHVPPVSLTPQQPNITAGSSNLDKYKGAVEALDSEIGRLLGNVNFVDTTVIFIGDNGTPNMVANNHERGRKGQLYQGGVHTPCIMSGKAVVGSPRLNDALVHVSDLFATIAELGGYDVDTDLPAGVFVDSLSAAPYLADPNLPSIHDKAFGERFAATPAAQDGKTVRDAQYKYIRFDDTTERLHDLTINGAESDVNELIANPRGQADIDAYNELSDCMDTILASPLPAQVESVEINGGDAQRSTVTEVVVRFDSNVAIDDVTAPAFQFTHIGQTQDADYDSLVELEGGKTKVTFTFSSGNLVEPRGSLAPTLERGVYQLAANASQITNNGNELDGDMTGSEGGDFLYGNVVDENLFRIYGDADGSGLVDFSDFNGYFLPAFGSTAGSAEYLDELDLNGDLFINFIDFNSGFLPNFGQTP